MSKYKFKYQFEFEFLSWALAANFFVTAITGLFLPTLDPDTGLFLILSSIVMAGIAAFSERLLWNPKVVFITIQSALIVVVMAFLAVFDVAYILCCKVNVMFWCKLF